MNIVPEKLVNFRVYDAAMNLLGLADVQLPSIEAMTETVKGAGIAGEFDSPTLGHYGSMTLGLNFRVATPQTLALAAPVAHALEIRGSIQAYNAALGIIQTQALKIVVRGIPKKSDLGKLAPGAPMETSVEFEVVYIKVFLGGVAYFEHDKLNDITVIAGVDHLAKVRADLGV